MLQRARMEAALWGARAKWFELGLALNLSEETLEVIFDKHGKIYMHSVCH